MKITNYLKDETSSLKKRSLDAINVFNKTIDSLKSVNEESLKKKNELTSKVDSINEEIKELNALSLNNVKIIEKIEKIIN